MTTWPRQALLYLSYVPSLYGYFVPVLSPPLIKIYLDPLAYYLFPGCFLSDVAFNSRIILKSSKSKTPTSFSPFPISPPPLLLYFYAEDCRWVGLVVLDKCSTIDTSLLVLALLHCSTWGRYHVSKKLQVIHKYFPPRVLGTPKLTVYSLDSCHSWFCLLFAVSSKNA